MLNVCNNAHFWSYYRQQRASFEFIWCVVFSQKKKRRKALPVLIFTLLRKGHNTLQKAADDFKMSFSSSLPCNSAAAFWKNKYQHLNHRRLEHSAKCHGNKEDTSDIYRIIQTQFMRNDLMKNSQQLHGTMKYNIHNLFNNQRMKQRLWLKHHLNLNRK